MTGEIHFFSEDTSFKITNEPGVKSWIEKTTRSENFSIGFLNFIFCSDSYLHKLNVEHLQHDTFTDIITFDYTEDKELSGDIFISVDRVEENSLLLKTDFKTELNRVVIHGVLHLMGYSDKQPDQKAEMREKEDFYLTLRDF